MPSQVLITYWVLIAILLGSVTIAISVNALYIATRCGSASTGKKRRGGPGGLNKLCSVSPLLQAIVGQPSLPRTEVWEPVLVILYVSSRAIFLLKQEFFADRETVVGLH